MVASLETIFKLGGVPFTPAEYAEAKGDKKAEMDRKIQAWRDKYGDGNIDEKPENDESKEKNDADKTQIAASQSVEAEKKESTKSNVSEKVDDVKERKEAVQTATKEFRENPTAKASATASKDLSDAEKIKYLKEGVSVDKIPQAKELKNRTVAAERTSNQGRTPSQGRISTPSRGGTTR